MKQLKVGIVGGAGRIGTALMVSLSADPAFQAFGICRNAMSAARLGSQGLQSRVVPTEDPAQLSAATSDLDVLINCAIPLYGPAKTAAAIERLAASLSAASAGKHLIHLSSVGVYGDFISNERDLFNDPRPDITYGRQKLYKENLLRSLAQKHSFKVTILRVGHVYGPELGWSEGIINLIKTEGFRLPFDGQLPSNAIWISNLCSGIREALLNVPGRDVLNITDVPQTTWRDIFDMHSEISGNPMVLPMLRGESERLLYETKKWAQTGIAGRLLRETLRWVKHLPGSYIAAVPTLKEVSQWASGKIGSESMDARLRASNLKRAACSVVVNSVPKVMPALVSEAVPGASLNYQGNSPEIGMADMRAWYEAISFPMGPSLTNIF